MEYIAGIVELDGEPVASSSIREEPNINKSNDIYRFESLISGRAKRVLVEQLFAVGTAGFVPRGLDEALGHMCDASCDELDGAEGSGNRG